MPEMPLLSKALRERKFRKEKPFAVMVQDLEIARALVELVAGSGDAADFGCAAHRAGSRQVDLAGVAPENDELGVMLALHAAASSACLPRAPGGSGDDQREPLQRADRL